MPGHVAGVTRHLTAPGTLLSQSQRGTMGQLASGTAEPLCIPLPLPAPPCPPALSSLLQSCMRRRCSTRRGPTSPPPAPWPRCRAPRLAAAPSEPAPACTPRWLPLPLDPPLLLLLLLPLLLLQLLSRCGPELPLQDCLRRWLDPRLAMSPTSQLLLQGWHWLDPGLTVSSPIFSACHPRDKRVVREPESEGDIWWGEGSPNIEMDEQ